MAIAARLRVLTSARVIHPQLVPGNDVPVGYDELQGAALR
jgi:hypothetical protein